MPDGYLEFEFDLPDALLDSVVRSFDGMNTAPLNTASVSEIPEAQGVYQLLLDGEVVYIGKTDSDAGLQRRLARHARKLLHRHNLDPARVHFKALRVFVFTAMDIETQLIRHYGAGEGLSWNGSGFGSNDPGRQRDYTAPGAFDQQFPIDIDVALADDFSALNTAAEVALRLKAAVPYTFRFQTVPGSSRGPHRDLVETAVTIPAGQLSARQVLEEMIRQLPPGWQATALSAVLILYKERKDDYPRIGDASPVLARSPELLEP
jgi:hypothetical protein